MIKSLSKYQTAISVQNLNHYFGESQLRQQVLFNISLEISKGEIVIMTGPSGSGKTTILSLIGALRSVQSGSLRVLGQELAGASTNKLIQARRNNGYIFQAHNLHRSLTALENVKMGLEVHNSMSGSEMEAHASHILHQVGLGHHIHHYPHNLSIGQKQRVAIARALVSHPSLVLADEPTASLDSKSGRNVVDLMYKLAKDQGCTILMVTHDNRILDIADRIIKLEDGQLSF